MKKKVVKKSLAQQTKKNKIKYCRLNSCSGGIYFFGFIGAIIYYIQNSISFGSTVLGILKAIVWPAILIYKLFGFLYGL